MKVFTDRAPAKYVMPNFLVAGLPISSPQFQHWFQGSKIVDAHGQPQIVFHETSYENAKAIDRHGFDLSKVNARSNDEQMPDGIFFKPSDERIGVTRERPMQLPFVLAIRNPLHVANREGLAAFLSQDPDYKMLARRATALDERIASTADRLMANDETWSRYQVALTKMFNKGRAVQTKLATKARALATQLLKTHGFDGLIVDNDEGGTFGNKTVTTIVAFSPAQVQRAQYQWN